MDKGQVASMKKKDIKNLDLSGMIKAKFVSDKSDFYKKQYIFGEDRENGYSREFMKPVYRGTIIDGVVHSKDDYENFMYMSCYRYLVSLVNEGHYSVLSNAIELSGERYKNESDYAAYSAAGNLREGDANETEEKAELMSCCFALSRNAVDYPDIAEFLLAYKKDKYKRIRKIIDDIKKVQDEYHGDNPEPTPSTYDESYELHKLFSKNETDDNIFTVEAAYGCFYALSKQDRDEPHGIISYILLTEEGAWNDPADYNFYHVQFDSGETGFTTKLLSIIDPSRYGSSLSSALQDVSALRSRKPEDYLMFHEFSDYENPVGTFYTPGSSIHPIPNSEKEFSDKIKALIAKVYNYRVKKYCSVLSCSIDDFPRMITNKAEEMINENKKTFETILRAFGTNPDWLERLDSCSLSGIFSIVAEDDDGIYSGMISVLTKRYLFRKMAVHYSDDLSIYTQADLLKGIISVDDVELNIEINDICHLLVDSIFSEYIFKLRKQQYIQFDPVELTREKDGSLHIATLKGTIKEKDAEIEILKEELKEYQNKEAENKNKERSCNKVERHEAGNASMTKFQKLEDEKEKYKMLYEQATHYIALLETPDAEDNGKEERDAEKECIEKLSGKRFLFVLCEPSIYAPDVYRIFRNSTFMESERDDISGLKLDGAVVFTKHISHSMFYKFEKYHREQYPDIPVMFYGNKNSTLLYEKMLEKFA